MVSLMADIVELDNLRQEVRARLLSEARTLIALETQAVSALAAELDERFLAALNLILGCKGRVIVMGLGKSGLVGQKISATLASTGTPSWFMHAAEASHGDLGRMVKEDVVLALSNSGESAELNKVLKSLKNLAVPVIAITSAKNSTLARYAAVVLTIGEVDEACPMGLVPTCSTTAMLVLGDALAMGLFNYRGYGPAEYARNHPGGQLGKRLKLVGEVMRVAAANPCVPVTASLREAIKVMTCTEGRPGATSVVEPTTGKLVGFFTDGDLRRLLDRPDFNVDIQIAEVMHKQPKFVKSEQFINQAERLLKEYSIDQVPVLDDEARPIGFLDVQDLLKAHE